MEALLVHQLLFPELKTSQISQELGHFSLTVHSVRAAFDYVVSNQSGFAEGSHA